MGRRRRRSRALAQTARSGRRIAARALSPGRACVRRRASRPRRLRARRQAVLRAANTLALYCTANTQVVSRLGARPEVRGSGQSKHTVGLHEPSAQAELAAEVDGERGARLDAVQQSLLALAAHQLHVHVRQRRVARELRANHSTHC